MKHLLPSLSLIKHWCTSFLSLMLVFSLPLNAQFSPPCQLEGDFDVKAVKRNQMACSGSVVFELLDEQNGGFPLSISVASASGFSYGSASYNPANGELEVSSINISAYNKIGNLWLEVETPNGICYLELNVVECCKESLASAPIVVNEDISTYVTGTSFTGNWVLMGDITFASGAIYDFDGASVYLGPDAQLLPETDVDLEIKDSDFEPFCDCRWDRILIPNATRKLKTENSSFKGALRAVMAESQAEIELLTSDFIDNRIAIYLDDFTGTGPFDGSYLKVDGSVFELTGPHTMYCYDDSKSNVNILNFLSDGTCTSVVNFINVVNSDNINNGKSSYLKNDFLYAISASTEAIAIWLDDAQAFIENNYFYENTAICSQNNSLVVVNENKIEGVSASSSNSQVNFNESSLLFEDNELYAVAMRIEEPTFFSPVSGANAGVEVLTNLFEYCRIDVDDNVNNSKVRIFDNRLDFSRFVANNFSAGSNGNLIFHSNYQESDHAGCLVCLDECDEANVSNNHIENLAYYVPDGSQDYEGLRIARTQDAVVANNYLEYFNRGLTVWGDCSNTDFTCNEFVNNYHAFYFLNYSLDPPVITDQGSASEATGNCFNYYYAGSTFPFGESLAGVDVQNNVDWHMTPPLTCNSTPQPNVDCECVYLSSSIFNIDLDGNASSDDCTVPSSFKRNPNFTPEYLADNEIIQFSIYPNPANTHLNIRVPENLTGDFLTLRDINGRMIYQSFISKSELSIDVSSYPSGVYILKVQHETRRLLIQK